MIFRAIVILFMIAIFLNSCKPSTSSGYEDNHDHAPSFQLTAYSDQAEVFAEASPFVAGVSSEILAHFSAIPGFKPIDRAQVKICLVMNGDSTFSSKTEIVKPGIYRIHLVPKEYGVADLLFIWQKEASFDSLLIFSVPIASSIEEAYQTAEALEVSDPNAVFFSKEQSWKIDFETNFPTISKQGMSLKTTAAIDILPSQLQFSVAGISGILKDDDNSLFPGKRFREGQIIAKITGNEMADNSFLVRLSAAKSRLDKAQNDYFRTQALAPERIISEKDLLDAKLEYEIALNDYQHLNARYSAEGQELRAPSDGYIHRVFAINGSFVQPGDQILSFHTGKKFLLTAEISPSFSGAFTDKLEGSVRLNQERSYSLDELNAELVSIGQSTQASNFLIPINISIAALSEFVPGTFAELNLISEGDDAVLIVPKQAIIEEQGKYFVYVQLHPELFEKRLVEVAFNYGETLGIRSGIATSERIVSRGALLIKLAQATGGLDAHAGHVH